MSDEQLETFGDVIQEIQGDLGQREFARLAGDVPPGNVNDWLHSRVPRLKQLLQVVEALEEAELLDPAQRERLFRAAGYVDPRRDRGGKSSASFATQAPSPAPDLKGFFANRQGQGSLDRLLRQYGELMKWSQAEGYSAPPLDGGSLGDWEALTDQCVDQYIQRLRDEAIRGGKSAN
ncbi:MAG: hypothetical protein ACO1SX_21025 [Actinomycetota bacterium]